MRIAAATACPMFGLREIQPHHSSRQVSKEIVRSDEKKMKEKKKKSKEPSSLQVDAGVWVWMGWVQHRCRANGRQAGLDRPTNQEGAFDGGGEWSISRVNQPSTSWQAWSLSPARLIYAGYECQRGGRDQFAAVVRDKWKWKALLPLRFLRVFFSDSLFFLISCLCIVALGSHSAFAHSEVQSVLVGA